MYHISSTISVLKLHTRIEWIDLFEEEGESAGEYWFDNFEHVIRIATMTSHT